jgi:hypothetical protein
MIVQLIFVAHSRRTQITKILPLLRTSVVASFRLLRVDDDGYVVNVALLD